MKMYVFFFVGVIPHSSKLNDRKRIFTLEQCFSTVGPRPGTGPWHQLYRAARGSPGICHLNFLSILHE